MKILIPLDGSHFAEAVLEPLSGLAGPDAELLLVQAVKESDARTTLTDTARPDHHLAAERGMTGAMGGSIPDVPPRVPAETQSQAQDRLRQEAIDYLHRINERIFGGRGKTEVVWGEEAAEALLEFAREQQVDLIAMATHGRTGLARIVLGSVADALLRAQVAPVYLVRPEALND